MKALNYKKFMAWWASVLLIGTGVFWAYFFGLVHTVWIADETYITSLIAVIFVVCNLKLGSIAYHIDSPNYWDMDQLKKKLETLWFMSEQMMALGMLGTVIGLIMMLSTTTVGSIDSGSMQGILSGMWKSMGLALYTNAVGLICSILLKLQVYYVGHGIDET
jgi:hypothetical protein